MSARSLPLDSLLGAMVTTILGEVLFSELAGRFVAGYLHGRNGALVGALSGIFAAVPKTGLLYALLGAVSPKDGGQVLF